MYGVPFPGPPFLGAHGVLLLPVMAVCRFFTIRCVCLTFLPLLDGSFKCVKVRRPCDFHYFEGLLYHIVQLCVRYYFEGRGSNECTPSRAQLSRLSFNALYTTQSGPLFTFVKYTAVGTDPKADLLLLSTRKVLVLVSFAPRTSRTCALISGRLKLMVSTQFNFWFFTFGLFKFVFRCDFGSFLTRALAVISAPSPSGIMSFSNIPSSRPIRLFTDVCTPVMLLRRFQLSAGIACLADDLAL